MSTATQTIDCSTDRDKEIVHLLDYARTKLLTEMPQQLKITSYLRLCCLAIRKLNRKLELAGKPDINEAFDNSYSQLLQALCHHNPEWWKHCWSSDRGILKSDDPTIDKLLQPLEYFVEIYTCKYSMSK
ncbi:MAG: hypothetical protein HC899_18930 [Leptolyngbyaceae cyanobacterium SM1_4_3]|nr:hypothetical protein [Leptolyngbyaceae cyanobacterium SM1_4_3]